jgi:glycosyltransferase involved in cell wall biosynthesis
LVTGAEGFIGSLLGQLERHNPHGEIFDQPMRRHVMLTTDEQASTKQAEALRDCGYVPTPYEANRTVREWWKRYSFTAMARTVFPGFSMFAGATARLKRTMLVTDVPPCTNFSGGLFIDGILKSINFGVRHIFIVQNVHIAPNIAGDTQSHVCMLKVDKPREWYSPGMTEAQIREIELAGATAVKVKILPALLAKAREWRIEQFWVLLEGQTMIRLARELMRATQLPVRVQVMDPPTTWLRAHGVDKQSTGEVFNQFDEVLHCAASCAAASWGMQAAYEGRYGVHCVPVVPALLDGLARPPAELSCYGAVRIGFAGQIYARKEWDALQEAIAALRGHIYGRKIIIEAFARPIQGVIFEDTESLRFHPWTTQPDLILKLAECDLLYCPYGFDEDFCEDATLCFPSKLTTYLAAGRPALFYGPEYSSPAKFLSQHNAGFLCLQPNNRLLADSIASALSDPDRYRSVAANGRSAFDKYLSRTALTASVRRFLSEGAVADQDDAAN